MIYKKPDDVTYTEMCIYIDTHIYTDNYDEQLVFQYLYLLFMMLSTKEHHFHSLKEYEDFSIYGASRLFMRYLNSQQYEFNDDGTPKMNKIKSVLNYLHMVLSKYVFDFTCSDYYPQPYRKVSEDNDAYSFNNVLIKACNTLHITDFNLTLNDIVSTTRHFLETIPYKNNSVTWINIYVSVLLTFLNSITLTRAQQHNLVYLKDRKRYTDAKLCSAFDKNRKEEPILFHLPENMRSYIILLSRELRHIVAKDLSSILHTKVCNDFLCNSNLVNEVWETTDDNKRTT